MSKESFIPGQELIPQRYFEPLDHSSGLDPRERLKQSEQKFQLTAQAHQDFSRAISLAESLLGEGRIVTLSYVGRLQAKSGFDVTDTLGRIHELAQGERRQMTHHVWEEISSVYVATGNLDTAERLLTENIPDYDPNIYDNAVTRAKKSENPNPLEDLNEQHRKLQSDDFSSDYLRIRKYPHLAKRYYMVTGEYPTEYLNLAEQNLQNYAVEYPKDEHLPLFYRSLASSFATCGNFEKAFQHAERITTLETKRPDSHLAEKLGAFEDIAQVQLRKGVYQDAIQTAERAMEITDQFTDEKNRDYVRAYNGATLTTLMAEAKARMGEDPTQFYQEAVTLITGSEIDSWLKAEVVVSIANSQHDVGIDASSTYQFALSILDQMPDEEKYIELYGFPQQVMQYQQLARAQAYNGYIKDAKVTLERIEQINTDGSHTDIIVETLADIAYEEARRGLSQEEMAKLTAEVLSDVLSTTQEDELIVQESEQEDDTSVAGNINSLEQPVGIKQITPAERIGSLLNVNTKSEMQTKNAISEYLKGLEEIAIPGVIVGLQPDGSRIIILDIIPTHILEGSQEQPVFQKLSELASRFARQLPQEAESANTTVNFATAFDRDVEVTVDALERDGFQTELLKLREEDKK